MDPAVQQSYRMKGYLRDSPCYTWPTEGLYRIPDWVYTSEEIFRKEVQEIFCGKTWSFVGLEAEIPNVGDFRRAQIATTSVIVVRGKEGEVNVVENRCAHRGTAFCRARRGRAEAALICPYHQWQYDLKGNLVSIPFRRGVNGKGGMPAEFKLEEHGLRKLKVATICGLIFASFSDDVEPLEAYLGPEVVDEIKVTFEGRAIKILGFFRQRWPANWKLYHENLRDPNHAGLLHVFLSTFGLFRPDNAVAQVVSACGRHSIGYSGKGGQQSNDTTAQMSSFRANLKLKDDRLLNYTKEDEGPWSAAIQSIWPNFAIQRQVNALAVREIVPKGPNEFHLIWTLLGYEGDTPEMEAHRLRQANLIGPGGLVGVDDSEVLDYVQQGLRNSVPGSAVVKLGKECTGTTDTFISEAAIRSMYEHYRKAMKL